MVPRYAASLTPDAKFSSGRLGHMWPYVNGVAMAEPGKVVFCLGSDGSQMEGDDSEAARLAVSEGLNVKLVIDDNDVTIAGHPSDYFKGYSVEKTLEGHGVPSTVVQGEQIDALYAAIRCAVVTDGPHAVVCKRPMCPGMTDVEGTTHGHDAVAVANAEKYFAERGLGDADKCVAAAMLPRVAAARLAGVSARRTRRHATRRHASRRHASPPHVADWIVRCPGRRPGSPLASAHGVTHVACAHTQRQRLTPPLRPPPLSRGVRTQVRQGGGQDSGPARGSLPRLRGGAAFEPQHLRAEPREDLRRHGQGPAQGHGVRH